MQQFIIWAATALAGGACYYCQKGLHWGSFFPDLLWFLR